MRVLLVEDQSATVEAITSSFGPDVVFDIATTRDEALELIEQPHFDVAVCDLKIPASTEPFADVEHGLAVLTAIRERCPGTPIIGFTAYKTKEVLDLLLQEQRREDYLGTLLERPMLSVMEKDELPEFLEVLENLRIEFGALDRIELPLELGQEKQDPLVCRVLQVYARQRECVIVHVTPLTGGRSGVPVLRVRMEREDGSGGGTAIARLAPLAMVDEEHRRFTQRVSGILPMGGYAESVGIVHAGAGHLGGIFYQLADDYRPLFAALTEDDEKTAEAVARLAVIQAPWCEGAPAAEVTLREIRRLLIPDDRWSDCAPGCGLDPASVTAVEASRILIRRGTVHGDLHGGNVLVATNPVLIDFAEVMDGPTPLDPVSLELSLLFHPDAPTWAGSWPTQDQLERWTEFEVFVVDCPFPRFVRACRKWATSVARGSHDVPACAYAYAASQARFETSDTGRLVPLMRGLVAFQR
jgi:CheY-like chemotaxis protein